MSNLSYPSAADVSSVGCSSLSLFVQPQRIVAATDLTDYEVLAPHLVVQAAAGAHVTLVHAIVRPSPLYVRIGLPYPEQERLDRRITGMVIDYGVRLRAEGVDCEVVAEHGSAADVLRRQIEATQATRLIMATHGRGRLGQLVLGSVAAELLRDIEIPIFALGPHGNGNVPDAPKRILHPVSLKPGRASQITFAMAVAQHYGAELILLHVLEPDAAACVDYDCRRLSAFDAMLDRLPNGAAHPHVHAEVRGGERVDRILECADRIKADWIITGPGRPMAFPALHENTAYRLMARARFPVLTCGRGELSAPANLHGLVQIDLTSNG